MIYDNFAFEEELLKKVQENPDFIKKHDLSETLNPTDWYKAILGGNE